MKENLSVSVVLWRAFDHSKEAYRGVVQWRALTISDYAIGWPLV